MNISWDAKGYAANFGFVAGYGADLIAMLGAPRGARVVDLGCGNGTLTARLAEAGFDVTGIDASEELLQLARSEHPHIRFVKADATDFSLAEPVDAIFSNAVFHWIDKDRQSAMLGCVARALKPGGELVCEFGGRGNNALIHGSLAESFSRRGLEYKMPFYFPSVGEYAPLVESCGFKVTFASLFERPTPLGEGGLEGWIRMFVKTPFAGIDEQTREEMIAEAAERLRPQLFRDGIWFADYVRLRLKAIRIPGGAA